MIPTCVCVCSSVNCSGHTEYKVNFDSNRLTDDCVNKGCQLKGQIEDIKKDIGRIGKYGDCTVDEDATIEVMEQEMNKRKVSLKVTKCLKNKSPL